MKLRIGIDVGGTFTDFFVVQQGAEAAAEPRIFKVLSTSPDPSVGLLNGLNEIAASLGISLAQLAQDTEAIVHGTTVTTNAVLTLTGAKTGLLTTAGVRDALEMRRGVREEQYNNRYRNVTPLAPRFLRRGIRGRLNYRGDTLEPLNLDDVREAIQKFKDERVEAVAVCFMNSFANPESEQQAAALVRRELPEAYLTSSSELLPAIRFYDRVSTTVLNSYVGPKLSSYLENLQARLKEIGFAGVLLVMQSNGGVMSPEVASRSPALTLLSGPAAGPRAGLGYANLHGHDNCITIDMGGTSFDAALVRDGAPVVATEGEINRYRIAFPMLDIVTIGAGGGSIAWIDEGGLLRLGPQSAGADPGPACYARGGTAPTCTDADLVLGYLNPDFFAGGKIKLDRDAAQRAIAEQIARPMGLSVTAAAAGIYQVINTNMAQGVREISIKRGFDPREFPLVVAGGAGPLHACMICQELEIPLFIVPRESSIFCAAGMLGCDLQHDFVSSFVSVFDQIDWKKLNAVVAEMMAAGVKLLTAEKIPEARRRFQVNLDCRYRKQYHEVSFPVEIETIRQGDAATVAAVFHARHQEMYGYALAAEGAPLELINVRLRAVGLTEKPARAAEAPAGSDADAALKGERSIYLPAERGFRKVPVYDGHQTRNGYHIVGPALIEQVNTTLLLTSGYDCRCDEYGSFVVRRKEAREPLSRLQEATP